MLAPGAASTSRDLYFDLTQPAPVATASFLQQDLNALRALSKVGTSLSSLEGFTLFALTVRTV